MFNIKINGDNELILYLNNASSKIRNNIPIALKNISTHLEKEVKDKFGKYQQSWPKLKRATVIAKYKRRSLKSHKRKGLNSGTIPIGADDPLILFGELEKSIKKESNNTRAKVYSNNPYSAVHEYGYAPKNIPARSFMRLTLMQEEDEVKKIVNKYIERAIIGGTYQDFNNRS